MSRYDRAFGRDWDDLDREAAVERAYALGVASVVGEYHRDELDRVRGTADSAYERSVVDLAFDEGRSDAKDIDPPEDEGDGDDEAETIWAELVEEEAELPLSDETDLTGGRDGLPEALDRMGALDRVDIDSRDRVDRPGFLDRD